MALGHKSLAGDSQSGPSLKPTRSHRERLAWYWARTAQMDAKEIVHRVVEGATKQLSRRLTQGWDAIKPAGTLVPLPFAATALRNCEPALAATIAGEAGALMRDDDGLSAIVVGLPRRLNGEPTDQTAVVEALVERLRGIVTIPVVLQDERLTSHEADRMLAQREKDWRKRKAMIDAAAAALILQDYLDGQHRSPGR